MDFTYNCTLAFLRLAIEQVRFSLKVRANGVRLLTKFQMRLTDPGCADMVRDHHLEKLARIFQLATNQRLHTAVDQTQRDAEGRFAERTTNLLDAVKQLLPAAPPGLGNLPELPTRSASDEFGVSGNDKNPQLWYWQLLTIATRALPQAPSRPVQFSS